MKKGEDRAKIIVSVQIHPHVRVGIFHGGAADHHWS
jgi:hypothetical protein